jgi:hypothetical protein
LFIIGGRIKLRASVNQWGLVMRMMMIAVAAAGLALPAYGLNIVNGFVSIRNNGGLTFQHQDIEDYGAGTLFADDGGYVTTIISAVNGGTIKMTAESYNSTFSFASLLYSFNVSGPADVVVPITISTKGSMFLLGNMSATMNIGVHWAGYDPVLGELSDRPFSRKRELCVGVVDCQHPSNAGGNWDLTDFSFNVVSNRDYQVELNVSLVQFGLGPNINAAGYGFGSVYIDPVFTLAPTVVGYTLNSTLSGPMLPVQAPVPEPASWALLIAGFGLVGAQVRRRRWSTVGAGHP